MRHETLRPTGWRLLKAGTKLGKRGIMATDSQTRKQSPSTDGRHTAKSTTRPWDVCIDIPNSIISSIIWPCKIVLVIHQAAPWSKAITDVLVGFCRDTIWKGLDDLFKLLSEEEEGKEVHWCWVDFCKNMTTKQNRNFQPIPKMIPPHLELSSLGAEHTNEVFLGAEPLEVITRGQRRA